MPGRLINSGDIMALLQACDSICGQVHAMTCGIALNQLPARMKYAGRVCPSSGTGLHGRFRRKGT